MLLSAPLASTFAGLGARHPDGGGVATFARQAFGPTAATIVGWCFYFGVPLGAPPAAGFAGGYVADLIGGGHTTQVVTTLVLILIVATLNWFGIRVSGRAQLVNAGGLAVLLATATAVSLPHADVANLTPFAPHGWLAVGAAASLLVWAFAGWEAVASLSADYADPAREIPRVTAIALVVIGVLYLGVAFATVAVLGAHPSSAPLSDLLQLGFGPAARPLTTVVALLLSLGAMNSYFASVARLGAALGRDGSLPTWFASTHAGIPRRSLVVTVAFALAVLGVDAVTGLPVESSVNLVTGMFSLVYVVASAAALRLLPRGSAVWWAALGIAAAAMAYERLRRGVGRGRGRD